MKRNAVSWAAVILSSAALVSTWGQSRLLPAAPKMTAESQKTARALSDAFNAVAESVRPSVVQITVERKAGAGMLNRGARRMPNLPEGLDENTEEMLRRFFNQGRNPNQPGRPEREQMRRGVEGVGSGFIFDEHGHILTNNHVVENAGKITVTFHDGVEARATVVGTDPQSDVAVIKVENSTYRPLPKAQSARLKVGELVMAVGSPYHLDSSVTTGIVSATERNSLGINEYESFIQTDAAINPGNSGGPLVNMDGEVVGINSAIMTGGRVGGTGGNDGVGFAIPIDMAASLADNLIKNGKVSRARVGIALEPLSPVMAKQLGLDPKVKGVVVGAVLAGSPAEKAGLKPGDVITGFNGAPVASLPNFRLIVAASEVGHEFGLKYWREGKEHDTTIVPAPADKVVFREVESEKPEGSKEEKKAEAPTADIKDFGLEVQPLTPDLAEQFGYAKDRKGLLVSNVKDGSPADAAGIEAGLLITRVIKNKGVQDVGTVKDFEAAAGKADDFGLYVETPKGAGRFVTLSKTKKD